MNNHTLMCSKLKELQETKDKNIRRIATPLEDSGIGIDDGGNIWIVCPDLEDLIGMLEENIKWSLDRYPRNKPEWVFEFIAGSNDVDFFNGNTPQEAMLKLVAWELWHKVWNDDKEVWEEG